MTYIRGYWWPPTYSIWTPTINSCSFSHLAQLTIFSRFSGPVLSNLFWGLNDPGGYWWPPTYSIIHPPIPFGPPPSILVAFHFQHNLLFLVGFWVLHSRSRFGALMIQVDNGDHPPIPFEPPPLVILVFN